MLALLYYATPYVGEEALLFKGLTESGADPEEFFLLQIFWFLHLFCCTPPQLLDASVKGASVLCEYHMIHFLLHILHILNSLSICLLSLHVVLTRHS